MIGEDPACHVSEKERKYNCALPILSSLLLYRQPCLTFPLFLLIIIYLYTAKLDIYILLPFDSFLWILLVDFIVQTLGIFHFYISIFFSTYYNIVRLQLWLTWFWCYIIIFFRYYFITFQIFITKYYNELDEKYAFAFLFFMKLVMLCFFNLSSFFVTQYFFPGASRSFLI